MGRLSAPPCAECKHQGNLMDVLWEWPALKHVANAQTQTMLVHGENDNDVPIAEDEQYYVALRDVGAEALVTKPLP